MDVFISRFLGSEDKETFFTRAQRSRMVYEILSATTFGREKKGEVKMIYTSYINIFIYYEISIFDQIWGKTFLKVGISRLVEEGAFNAAFPLHDVSITLTEDKIPLDKNVLLSRDPTNFLEPRSLITNWMPDKSYTNSGQDGANGKNIHQAKHGKHWRTLTEYQIKCNISGTSISHSTISETTLGNKLLYILRG